MRGLRSNCVSHLCVLYEFSFLMLKKGGLRSHVCTSPHTHTNLGHCMVRLFLATHFLSLCPCITGVHCCAPTTPTVHLPFVRAEAPWHGGHSSLHGRPPHLNTCPPPHPITRRGMDINRDAQTVRLCFNAKFHDHTMTNQQIWGIISRITRHSGIIISGINAFSRK